MATAGIFDFQEDVNGPNIRWDYWYASWYAYSSWYGHEREPGSWPMIKMGPDDNWQEKWKKSGGQEVSFKAFRCFGLPLISMSKPEDVEESLITPLLALIK
jgi:hypothetical protein